LDYRGIYYRAASQGDFLLCLLPFLLVLKGERKMANENDTNKDNENGEVQENNSAESPDNTGAEDNEPKTNEVLELLKQMQEEQKQMQQKLDRYQNLESLLIKSGAIVNDDSNGSNDSNSDSSDDDEDWLNSINIDKLNLI
jgi:hypothetical protein